MLERDELVAYVNQALNIRAFAGSDYCPNGLQVSGKQAIQKVVTGVTSNLALIESAVQAQADVLLVHHGFFWKNEDPTIVGMKQKRLKCLLASEINLLVYHLPLDYHPVWGNNAQLAKLLGIELRGPLEAGNSLSIGNIGVLKHPESAPKSVEEFRQKIATTLNRDPLFISGGEHLIQSVGICTGAAQHAIHQAVAQNMDAYITGEVSENTVHVAREMGIHFFACGHHATERYGVQALGEHLASHFGIEHEFIDIDNPV